MRKNTVYTKGFVNDDGCIEVPGFFLRTVLRWNLPSRWSPVDSKLQ